MILSAASLELSNKRAGFRWNVKDRSIVVLDGLRQLGKSSTSRNLSVFGGTLWLIEGFAATDSYAGRLEVRIKPSEVVEAQMLASIALARRSEPKPGA